MATQIKREAQNLIIDGTLASISFACGTALLAGDSYLPDAALAGFGSISLAMLIGRHWPWRQQSNRRVPLWGKMWTQFASIHEIPSTDPGMRSWYMRWKERQAPEDEFIFDGLGISVPVPEYTFRRFIRIARHRQLNALYDTKFSMRWTGNGYSRTKINWVLSQEHFTRRTQPRFPHDEYRACLEILGYTRLMSGERRSGSSGRLLGRVGEWSTEDYVQIAIEKWCRLTSPPSRSRFGLKRFFTN